MNLKTIYFMERILTITNEHLWNHLRETVTEPVDNKHKKLLTLLIGNYKGIHAGLDKGLYN